MDKPNILSIARQQLCEAISDSKEIVAITSH
jgi:hypothetical protein